MPAHRAEPHRWTDEEVANLLYIAVNIRLTDPRAASLWKAVDRYSVTWHPIELRRLQREVAKIHMIEPSVEGLGA